MSSERLSETERAAIQQGFREFVARELDELPGELERVVLGGASAASSRTGEGRNPTMPDPVLNVCSRRSAARRTYDKAASFAGPLVIIMISGSIGLFLGATLVMER
ncbi:hypothetical protein [Streptomyces sp. NPDC006459]|uniref:hypothetical protein n=1 Tax=Streptomyces sp. NPDC006459 TaxID=3154303 RepID=UPI0033A6F2AF